MPIPPTECGKYTLVAKIGHGGMAEVLVGVASGIGGFQKLAVVKRIHPQLLEEPEFVNMFLDEARLAARLSHPNVIETYDVGEHDGIPFIAMEYLEGTPLDRLVKTVRKRGETFPIDVAVGLSIQSLQGLHYAHDLKDFDGSHLGVVHRDISPSNLFLTYQGTVKVLDFGIAKATTKLAETRTGQIKGKLAYMSPEQARGRGVDHRSDIWAIGVMLYELCTGQRLFKRETEIETLQDLLTANVDEILLESSAAIPAPVLEVLRKALQRNKEDRWKSAHAMSLALKEALERMEGRPTDMAQYAADMLQGPVEAQRVAVADLLERARGVREDGSGRLSMPSPRSTAPTAPTASGQTVADAPQPRRSYTRPAMAVVLFLLASAVGALAAVSGGEDVQEMTPAANEGAVRGAAAAPPSEPEPQPVSVAAAAVDPSEQATAEQLDGEELDGEELDGEELDGEENGIEGQGEVGAQQSARARLQRMQRLRQLRAEEARRRAEAEREAPSEQSAEPDPVSADPGYLTLITTPWSEVFLGSRSLGTTPLYRVQIPSGSHTLRLRNGEAGIDTSVQLAVPAGETVTRRLGLQ